MFYEESYNLESGGWCFRTTPNGAWIPFTEALYCQKIQRMQEALQRALSATTGDKHGT